VHCRSKPLEMAFQSSSGVPMNIKILGRKIVIYATIGDLKLSPIDFFVSRASLMLEKVQCTK
jgi:hypothetical protein